MTNRIRWGAARAAAAGLLLLLAAAAAHAGWKGFDQFDEREDSGIFSRANQKRLDNLAIAGVVGLAVVEGTETKLGRTAWQALDAALLTAATTESMKRIFTRPRPVENPDPGAWFAGGRHRSFPSGEVAMMAAFTTPFILAYKDEHPAAWALAAVPLYMAKGRMASQAHWLTDVAAGAAIGAGMGYFSARRNVPLVLSVVGRTTFIGVRYRF